LIKFNYFNSLKDNNLKNGLKLCIIENYKDEDKIKDNIINKKHAMMDWIDLPNQEKKEIEKIQLLGKKISSLYENFIVLGIGGSALGAEAIRSSLYDEEGKIKVEIVDNVDAEMFEKVLKEKDIKKTFFNVVTKSGKTVEILSLFSYVVERLKQELGDQYFVNLLITTEKDNVLWKYCENNKINTMEIPKGVGGRYSVLCPVGLFPCAVMGINLQKILLGAKKVLDNFISESLEKNICFKSALLNYNYLLKGKREIVLLPYSSRLEKMADFYIQLLSESLGKEKLLNNKDNKLFFTPTKAVGVTYQHSLLQVYQEGASNRLFCFINLERHNKDIKIQKLKDKNLDELLPKTLTNLFKAEQIASSLALKQAGHPSYEINVPLLNEENIGALLFYFELTTAIMGELMNVNAYNQNGVELQKKYTKAIVGVPGFEKERQELIDMINEKEKYEI